METEITQYFDWKRKLYDHFIDFIKKSEYDDEEFTNFIKIMDSFIFKILQEEFVLFLRLIVSVTNNHKPHRYFFLKIEKVLQHIKGQIINTLSQDEIYQIFESNKLLLLILVKSHILIFDENLYNLIKCKKEPNGIEYLYFFIPEIIQLSKDESEKYSSYINDISDYEEKRQQGENDNYLCYLIRNDSVIEFIKFINSKKISISSKVPPSIFEINSFLNENEPTLIEYAAFYGSVQIYHYLKMNMNIKSSICLYAIHSNNSDFLINVIDNDYLEDKCKESCIESIKCHHNDIANYILDNFIHVNGEEKSDEEKQFDEDKYSTALKFHNYLFFPNDYEHESIFLYLCQHNNINIVNCLMELYISKISKDEIENSSIQKAADNNQIKLMYYLLSSKNKTEEDMFEGNQNLKQIVLPRSIQCIGNNSFKECRFLKNIIIPSSVTLIEGYAFSNCISLSQITIPSSLTSIEDYAFSECMSLSQITIPSSVKSIGNYAFYHCKSLCEVNIPCSVNWIGNNAFNRCKQLVHISISSSAVSIEQYSFCSCSLLKQITIPSSVKSIGNSAFSECYSLTSITIPSSVISIGKCAFNKCKSLTQLIIPFSVISIGSNAFSECSSLKNIIMHASITSIADGVFNECISLEEITIPFSVESFGKCAFKKCIRLVQIQIPSSVTSIGANAFDNCSLLTQISISPLINRIENGTFNQCSSLVNVIIPSTVSYIGKYAFNGCVSLKQIFIPSSVYYIRPNAFNGCTSLTRIIAHSYTKLENSGINSYTKIERYGRVSF